MRDDRKGVWLGIDPARGTDMSAVVMFSRRHGKTVLMGYQVDTLRRLGVRVVEATSKEGRHGR
jgi:hypothetical protein